LKRIAAILLLSVFVLNLGGFFLVFKIQQRHVRKEIKEQIRQGVPEGELTVIKVTPENESELEWEHSKEFEYKGMMYDVVRKIILDETTILYYCVSDTQETELFAYLEDEIKKSMDTKKDGKNSSKNLFKLLSGIYAQPQKHVSPVVETGITFTCEYSHHYSSPELVITSPPPKIA
jgi:hypothetical protein